MEHSLFAGQRRNKNVLLPGNIVKNVETSGTMSLIMLTFMKHVDTHSCSETELRNGNYPFLYLMEILRDK